MSKEEKVPKMGTIAWHKYMIKKKSKIYSKNAKSREYVNKDKGTDKEHMYKRTSKKPKSRYASRIQYDFLMYIRVVYKWAQDNSGLSRGNLELLLYLYGIGAFSKKQFHDFHKLVGLYQDKKMRELIEQGWIKMWRPADAKKKQYALYTLTHRGKHLCSSMHKYLVGDAEIPTLPSKNKMMREGAPRINNYYMDIVKRMNRNKQADED